MRVRLGWQNEVDGTGKTADLNPKLVPGTGQALPKCMDGSCEMVEGNPVWLVLWDCLGPLCGHIKRLTFI